MMQPITAQEVKKTSGLSVFLLIFSLVLLFALMAVGYFGFTKYEELNKKINDLTIQNTALQAEVTRLKEVPVTENDSEEPVDPTADWKTYNFVEDGFTIRYPSTVTYTETLPTAKNDNSRSVRFAYKGSVLSIGSRVGGHGGPDFPISSEDIIADGVNFSKIGYVVVGQYPGDVQVAYSIIGQYPSTTNYHIEMGYLLKGGKFNVESLEAIEVFDSIVRTFEFSK
jgi:cell division protein FtsB